MCPPCAIPCSCFCSGFYRWIRSIIPLHFLKSRLACPAAQMWIIMLMHPCRWLGGGGRQLGRETFFERHSEKETWEELVDKVFDSFELSRDWGFAWAAKCSDWMKYPHLQPGLKNNTQLPECNVHLLWNKVIFFFWSTVADWPSIKEALRKGSYCMDYLGHRLAGLDFFQQSCGSMWIKIPRN